MRKPLIALSLALAAGLGATPAAVLASQSHSSFKSSRARSNSVSGAQIVRTALRYLGVPYALTGATPQQGFSCIGFVSYVYHQNGIPLPGDLGGAMGYAQQVPFSQLQPGDILYFQNTLWNGLSHTAIYLGGGRFVHSEYFGYGGVRISSFNNDPRDGDYWISKYLGANRPWGGVSVAPVVTNPTGAVSNPSTSVVKTVAGGTPATVTASGLNVRASHSKSSAVQTTVPRGSSLTIIGKSGGWYEVQLSDGTTGWVVSYGVSRSPSSVASPTIGNTTSPKRLGAPSTARPKVAATVNGLRVHASASTSAPVVGSVSKGQRVQVISRQGGWTKVRTSTGAVGWVVSSYTAGSTSTRSSVTQAKAVVRSSSIARRGPSIASTVSGLRIHSSPSLTASSVGSLGRGQRVQIVGRSGNWVEVRTSGGATGWVDGSYTSGSTGSSVAKRASSTSGRLSSSSSRLPVLTAGVRVHASPGVRTRVVGLAAAGTHVRVLGYRNGWALVRLPSGMTGYVAGSYVR